MFDVHTMGSFAVLAVETGTSWLPALRAEALTFAVWLAGAAAVGAMIGRLRDAIGPGWTRDQRRARGVATAASATVVPAGRWSQPRTV